MKSPDLKYAKLNIVHLKKGKRIQNTDNLKEFFEEINKKIKGMRGFIIMDNLENMQETIVITFWETKEDMDEYYRADNKLLSDFVLKSAANFESSPARKDYEITDLYIY